MMIKPSNSHALVIGAGISGLSAARVLLNHFSKVTILEKDHLSDEPLFRPGVPQGRHAHTFLIRGQRELETLFPGIGAKLRAQGAVSRDFLSQSIYYYGGRCQTRSSDLHGYNCSRLLMEWQMRQELLQCERIHFLDQTEVINVMVKHQRICGVEHRRRNQYATTNEVQQLHADLVVDASGWNSQSCEWLQKHGYEVPQETVIDTRLGYTTRLYEPPANFHAPWKAIAIQATGESSRGGVLLTIEGNRWMVVLAGKDGDYPPHTNEQAYLDYARELPDSALYHAIKDAKPLSPIYTYRRTENRHRHYEKLHSHPGGFIILGDAACVFNPIYGQGMTVAILAAKQLDHCLAAVGNTQKLPRLFHKKLARLLAFPWLLATAADASTSQQKKSLGKQYVTSLIALFPHSADVFLTFLKVIHMVQSPIALFHPSILVRIIRNRQK